MSVSAWPGPVRWRLRRRTSSTRVAVTTRCLQLGGIPEQPHHRTPVGAQRHQPVELGGGSLARLVDQDHRGRIEDLPVRHLVATVVGEHEFVDGVRADAQLTGQHGGGRRWRQSQDPATGHLHGAGHHGHGGGLAGPGRADASLEQMPTGRESGRQPDLPLPHTRPVESSTCATAAARCAAPTASSAGWRAARTNRSSASSTPTDVNRAVTWTRYTDSPSARASEAGMIEAARQFRRVNGHLHIPAIRAALERHVAEQNPSRLDT